MSELTKYINSYFKTAVKSDIDKIREKIMLTERQEKIFDMYYIKGQSIGFISDSLFVCPMVINNELKTIRNKLSKII